MRLNFRGHCVWRCAVTSFTLLSEQDGEKKRVVFGIPQAGRSFWEDKLFSFIEELSCIIMETHF